MPLSGKLLIVDALQSSSISIKINRSEEQVEKVLALATNFENNDYELFCGVKKTHHDNEISAEELKKLIKIQNIQIIDVREEWEQPKVDELNMVNIPLQTISMNLDKIDRLQIKVIVCQHGVRSLRAIDYLQQNGFENLINLTGGIVTWK